MSQQKPDEGEDDEIWRSLFGDGSESKSQQQQKKGYTTLQTKDNKRKSSRHDKKRRKTDHRSTSRSSISTNTSQEKQEKQQQQEQENGDEHGHENESQSTNHDKHSNDSYHQDGPSTAERLSQFLCTPKNRARLPPPPLKCKFLKYPHGKHRFTKYCATNLELNYCWDLHHDSLFPLPLDLMDPDYYNPLKNPSDYDEDEQPLNRKEDERILQLLEEREYKRSAKEEQPMPEQEAFLLQTQYLTGGQEYELTESQRKVYDRNDEYDGRRKNNKKRGIKRRRQYDDHDIDDGYYNNYSSNITNNPHSSQNVKQTFIDIQNIVPGFRHPRKDTVAQKVYDVFPHDGLLEIAYTHVQFANNPSMHTKKCSFMPKFHEERLKMAELCTTNALLRCVNKKQLQMEREKNSKKENDDLDDDDDDDDDDDNDNDDDLNNMNPTNNDDPDWFSLYSSNGKKKRSEYDDEELIKYEWCSEYAPIKVDGKRMHFLIIPSDTNKECEEVYYANLSNRISLRHRPTDSSQDSAIIGGKKGLSEEDKKFFKQQPKNIRLNVPRSRDSDDE